MYPSYPERMELLQALESMAKEFRKEVEEALIEDYVTHPPYLVEMLELGLAVDRSRFVQANLKKWMRPLRVPIDRPAPGGESKGSVMFQPVGVLGNMAAWNFPFCISLGPLPDMLAAGNRVMIKPSELAPACALVIKEMVSKTFDRNHVAVVTGEVDLAEEFAGLPWDHLLYTGGQAVGKLVMRAASENLTPVTLELGGKCPVIIAEDSVDAATVSDIILVKTAKNGQGCICPDYVFVPEDKRDEFVSLFREVMPAIMPSYTDNPNCTGIINQAHFDRLLSYLGDAERKGARLVQPYSPEEPANPEERKVPFTLVLDPNDEMVLMKEEIFGPILPVMTYSSIDEAVDYVNGRGRPLALYCYSKGKKLTRDVLMRTISGGACVNAVAMHIFQPSMPFGGVGNSGMGRYGGFEGFKTFSNQRAVFEKVLSA